MSVAEPCGRVGFPEVGVRTTLIVAICLAALSLQANIITDENAKPGTTAWKLSVSATDDVEGYASATSVAPGESIQFFVSSSDPSYTIQVFRMGWYGGKGGRQMTDAVERSGIKQTVPQPDPVTGMVACDWSDPYTLTIPSDWVSGVYLAKLVGKPSGHDSYIIFVVRSTADRAAQYTAVTAVTTYQAYNNWGSKSLYPFNSTGEHAVKVSFNRPYAPASGAGDFLYGAEYPMVRFLEREGYDVTYLTDIDIHEHGEQLLRTAAVLDIGHDEYWTREMRFAYERARDLGVNLAFFSANDCYWQIRMEDNDRTIVGYKDLVARDPVLLDSDPSNDKLATTHWRDVGAPEDALIGTMYTYASIKTDIIIGDTSHWIFDNTGLKSGDKIPGLLGYEVDRSTATAYPGTIVLTHSPFQHSDGTPDESNMTIYTAKSGALVFGSGTIYWSWGVDDFNATARPNAPPSAAVAQMTKNLLAQMTQRANVPPPLRRRATTF
jgi:hypothetical protein